MLFFACPVGVVNSNIFVRIFGNSTVHLDREDLLELKDLEFSELSISAFLNIQSSKDQ
jgi:hypothetical protein